MPHKIKEVPGCSETNVLLLALAMLLSVGSVLAEEKLPIAENFGDIKLRVAVIGDPAIEDWETNAYVKWLEEKTNIDLSFDERDPGGRRRRKAGPDPGF